MKRIIIFVLISSLFFLSGCDKKVNKNIEIGDKVNFIYDKKSGYDDLSDTNSDKNNTKIPQEKLEWYILSINNQKVKAISNITNAKLFFKGEVGFNNGEHILNDIAKELYSNTSLGIYARSVNIDDYIENMNAIGLESANSYLNKNDNIDINGKNVYFNDITILYPDLPNCYDNVKIYNTLFNSNNNGYFWIATKRYIHGSGLHSAYAGYFYSDSINIIDGGELCSFSDYNPTIEYEKSGSMRFVIEFDINLLKAEKGYSEKTGWSM